MWHAYLWCQVTVCFHYRFCTLLCPTWTFSSAFFKTDKLYTHPAHYRNLALSQELCATWDLRRSLSMQTVNWDRSKYSSGDPWQGSNASWLGYYRDIAPVIAGRRYSGYHSLLTIFDNCLRLSSAIQSPTTLQTVFSNSKFHGNVLLLISFFCRVILDH